MDKDLEKKIKAVERVCEIADMENMHGAEMAQGIEMNEEIEEKLALIKRLQSKLRFFQGYCTGRGYPAHHNSIVFLRYF